MSRERPKVQAKPEPSAELSEAFTKGLEVLEHQAPKPRFYNVRFDRTSEKHPRAEFEEKNAGKKWRPWELLKIWAPQKDAEGNIFVAKSSDSRQQRRHRQRVEAYAYMKEHFGGEPREIRQSMARDKIRNFYATEKKLAAAAKV